MKRNHIRIWIILGIFSLATGMYAQQSGLRFEFGRAGDEVKNASEGRSALKNAKDVFVITTEQVNTTPEDMGNGTIVKIKAKIDSIIHSTQPRDIGDVIIVRYRTAVGTPYEKSMDPMIPEQGSKLKVYLKYTGAGRYYRLAAGGYSFVRMNTGTQADMPDTQSDVQTGAVPYSDPYRAGSEDQSETPERQRLKELREGDAMPHSVDPYAGKPSGETHEKNMDPYEPISL